MEQWQIDLLKEALKKFALLEGKEDEADLYISEAEHQDGLEYWNNFVGVEDLLEDFRLFLASLP